jgi:ElaA protein
MSVYPAAAVLHREWAADLTPARLYALLRLRIAVFVIEQNCPYQELDGLDLLSTTRHFWIASAADPQEPIAALRLLENAHGEFRIGRVCTALDARGRGLGRRLMEAALAEIGKAPAVLHAQVHASGMYANFGFRPDGEEYLEDGIPHIPMRRH